MPEGPRTATFVVDGSITRAAIPDLCQQLDQLLEVVRADLVVCDVGGVLHADAVVLDALARLQLTARRAGCAVQFQRVSEVLHGLLALTGFAEVLCLGDGPADQSVVEVGRQPEQREQVGGVQEGVEPDDPVT